MILSHILIIEAETYGDNTWEIKHPDECWVTVPDWDGNDGYRDTNCSISGKINWDPDAINEFGTLLPGRYTLTYDCTGEGEMYDDWLVIGCGRLFDHRSHEGCPGQGPDRVTRSLRGRPQDERS